MKDIKIIQSIVSDQNKIKLKLIVERHLKNPPNFCNGNENITTDPIDI